MDSLGLLIKMIGALAMILGLLMVAVYLLKRFGRINIAGGKGYIEVVENKMFLPKKYLSLVRVAGDYFLIGSTDEQIAVLGRLSQEEVHRFEGLLSREMEKSTLAKDEGKI